MTTANLTYLAIVLFGFVLLVAGLGYAMLTTSGGSRG